jgi:hypothetical protein
MGGNPSRGLVRVGGPTPFQFDRIVLHVVARQDRVDDVQDAGLKLNTWTDSAHCSKTIDLGDNRLTVLRGLPVRPVTGRLRRRKSPVGVFLAAELVAEPEATDGRYLCAFELLSTDEAA